MVLLVILGWAAPVSAHPILLRSDPAPQTTVAVAPDVVRLYFSEPVGVLADEGWKQMVLST